MNTATRDAIASAQPLRDDRWPVARIRSCVAIHPPWQWVAAALVALLAFGLAQRAAEEPDFNPDESRWISRAHYLAALGEPLGTNWVDRYMTRGQPPLGSYAMGIGLVLQGRDLATNPPWEFNRSWEVNVALGRKPVAADLAAGRRLSAVFVALTTLAIVALARLFVPPGWAIAAGALFAVHPFTTYVGAIAMSDALFGLLIAATAVAAASLARRPSWFRAMLVGTLIGLGGATKLSPLILAPALAAGAFMLLFEAWIHHDLSIARAARYAALSVVVLCATVVTFIASYPYLWPDPVGRSHALFQFRTQEMATQASDWPEMAVPSRLEALRRAGMNFSERFTYSDLVTQVVQTDRAPAIVRWFEIFIPLCGLALMVAIAARAGPLSAPALALAVLGIQGAVTILGMRSEFDRYHLPIALLGVIAFTVALERFTSTARSGWVRWRPLETADGGHPPASLSAANQGRGRVAPDVGHDEKRLASSRQPQPRRAGGLSAGGEV